MREESSLLTRHTVDNEDKVFVRYDATLRVAQPWKESRQELDRQQLFQCRVFVGFLAICAVAVMSASGRGILQENNMAMMGSHESSTLDELTSDGSFRHKDGTSDEDTTFAPADEMTLQRVSMNEFGARCLDGSEVTYYFREGFGTGSNKWMIFLEGGGWCVTLKECYEWAVLGTSVGSSLYQDNKTSQLRGIHSVDEGVNPTFFNWNHVYVNYCDGGSYSGYRSEPVTEFGEEVFFHGKYIVPSVLTDLTSTRDLVNATDLVFGGESSGALGAMLNANSVVTFMKRGIGSKASVRIISDAGWFVQMPDHAGENYNSDWFSGVAVTHNVTGHLNTQCLERHAEDSWRCMLPNYNYPYISAPLFIIQSSLDIYQLEYFYFHDEDEGIACVKDPMRNCTQDLFASTEDFRKKLLKNLELPLKTPTTGMFVDACWAHVQTKSNSHFNNPKVQSTAMVDVISAWYNLPDSSSGRIKIVDNTDWPHANQICDDDLDWESWLNRSGNSAVSP